MYAFGATRFTGENVQCKGYIRNCRICEAHFDRANHVKTCPNCGVDMRCTAQAVTTSNYCKEHGGPQPQYGWYGPGRAPVTGQNSNSRLVKLASRHLTLTNDPRYLSNRHSMEIVWERVAQLVERIEQNEDPNRLGKLFQLWNEFRSLDDQGRTADAVRVKSQIDAEFQKVYHDYNSWTQLFEAVDLYRKMTESEVKIAKDLKAMMTAEDGMELVSQLLAIVIQVVNDPNQLKRIIYEFRKLVGDSADRVEEIAHSRAGGGGGEVIDA